MAEDPNEVRIASRSPAPLKVVIGPGIASGDTLRFVVRVVDEPPLNVPRIVDIDALELDDVVDDPRSGGLVSSSPPVDVGERELPQELEAELLELSRVERVEGQRMLV